MYSEKRPKFLVVLLAALALSCGAADKDLRLRGDVNLPTEAGNLSTPRFVVVTTTSDFAKIFSDPMNTIVRIGYVTAGDTSFEIDLSDTDLPDGASVFIVAYTDRDYAGGIPFPDTGDYVGLYIDDTSFDTMYRLNNGAENYVSIDINRRVYDFESKIEGTLLGNDRGNVILAAYTGEITSINFSELEADNIIGYQIVRKGTAPQRYSLTILPYGRNVPISDVFICGILDRNKNGVPDAGDTVGFYSNNKFGTPTTITVSEGTCEEDVDIAFNMELGEAAPDDKPQMTISGSFTPPAGYNEDSGPVYLFVSKAGSGSAVFSNLFSGLQYFVKLPAGQSSFAIDLQDTGLMPGDAVSVYALWDKNYTGGFVTPDAGDKVGIYEKREDFTMAKTLVEGDNVFNLTDGWTFDLNRTIYDHNMKLTFQIERGALFNSRVVGKTVTVIVAAKSGVNDEWTAGTLFPQAPTYVITDMDKIICTQNIVVTSLDSNGKSGYFTVDIFPFLSDLLLLSEELTVSGYTASSISEVYVFAILDSNNNGIPENGEPIGYYWYTDWLTWYYYPESFGPLENRTNALNKTVRFSTETYGD